MNKIARMAAGASLALALLLAWSAPLWAGWEDGYSTAEVIDLAKRWEERVQELETEIDTLEYQHDFVKAALKQEYVPEKDAKFLEWNVRAVENGLEDLRQELRQARIYRDVFKAGLENPSIIKQLEKTMRARHELVSALLDLYDWYPPDIWVPKQMPWWQRELLLRDARAAQDEFDRQNTQLGVLFNAALGGSGSSSSGARESGGKPCFPAGVLVLMADGTYRPIESVRPGDRVLALDTEAGRVVSAPVAEVRSGQDNDIWLLDHGLASNGAHRFYTNRGLVAARDLRPGDVLTGRDGPLVLALVQRMPAPATAGLEPELGGTEVHNIIVEGAHTFYVSGDGRTAYLVHDDCGCGP